MRFHKERSRCRNPVDDPQVWLGLLLSFVTMMVLMAIRESFAQDRRMELNRFSLFGFELFQALLQEGHLDGSFTDMKTELNPSNCVDAKSRAIRGQG